MLKPTIKNPKLSNNKKTNFNNSFIYDFGLDDSFTESRSYVWTWGVKAQERFHLPITFMNTGAESTRHYSFKQQAHDYIYENYYLNNDCKFFVTTELEQIEEPFTSYIDGAEKVFYTLDVCIVRLKDNQIFDIEIDGKDHLTRGNIMRDDRRDRWLRDRYGILTHRIDYNQNENINFKNIDKFISQPAAKNEHYDIHKRYTIPTDSEERIRRKRAGAKKKNDPNSSKN